MVSSSAPIRLALGLLLWGTGCVRAARPDLVPGLTVDEVVAAMPARVADREGWARDLLVAFDDDQLPADPTHVCAVLAIVEQESGFQANPAVPNLAAIARRELTARAAVLGPLAAPALTAVLEVTPEGGHQTFDQRLSAVRTEADLDRLYRDILVEEHRRHPVAYVAADLVASLFSARDLDARNPITTAGSMQVSVRFAESHAATLGRSAERARDELYTRRGGLTYGAARLWDGPSDDVELIHRFADYNAGLYSSRNAAFQEQLAALTGATLALDGDLLAYTPAGELKTQETKTMDVLRAFAQQSHGALSVHQVEVDARAEKTLDFERTRTWAAVKQAWAHLRGHQAPYARLPDVTLSSPKLSSSLSTAWFATSVDKRYRACLQRGGFPAP